MLAQIIETVKQHEIGFCCTICLWKQIILAILSMLWFYVMHCCCSLHAFSITLNANLRSKLAWLAGASVLNLIFDIRKVRLS